MSYRVGVDAELCISSGRCVAERPDVFRFDDDELAEVVPGAPEPADDAAVALARGCPSGAISLVDPATGAEIDVD
ncbi:ferredoxin [Actinomycetospora soli]|uniref:ferredoxin n=1 Tax=Actinomycetospora soli TaxID=2893887 RepID=UPI001E2CD1FE|nr:ferredoxin [Actinomycetospora soli]MCD2187907.1 ferredoxin [Actinomycetospora soli]